jgi:hypothetical protein
MTKGTSAGHGGAKQYSDTHSSEAQKCGSTQACRLNCIVQYFAQYGSSEAHFVFY